MSSSELEDSILITIGNYACERNLSSILEYLKSENRSKVADEVPLLLSRFRNLLIQLENEQKSTIVKELLEVVEALSPFFSGTNLGSTVKTLLYRLRLLVSFPIAIN